MKLCIDCKHHYDGYSSYNMINWGGVDYCTLNAQIEPVRGNIADRNQLIRCSAYRAEVSHIENKCGPDGKHWEAKIA